MEHTGRVWFAGDDEATAADATVEIESDDHVVVRVGDSLVADWPLVDVTFSGDLDSDEIAYGDARLLFSPDDADAWGNEVAAARLRTRLLTATVDGDETPGDGDADVVLTHEVHNDAALAPGSYCRACGSPIDPRAQICVHCGVAQYPAAVPHPKSRVTAGLFALFLGGFGAHHFYLGHTGRGILYLLFSWTFIPAIIAFIEALVFFFSSDASFDAKYNRY
jgi:TM2 domain-containing membrane protein YozV